MIKVCSCINTLNPTPRPPTRLLPAPAVTYSATAVDSVEDVLTSRAEDLKPRLVVAMDAPITHGGIEIDCAAKLRR